MPQFMANQVYYLGSNKGARRARTCRGGQFHSGPWLELYNLLLTYTAELDSQQSLLNMLASIMVGVTIAMMPLLGNA